MSIMGILNVASKALAAQKTAIDVTGQNIANVSTPGYTRQSVILENSGGSVDYLNVTGNGVRVAAVQRAKDIFLQGQTLGETGKETALQDAMAKVEPLFADTTTTGLGTSLQNFYNAWQDLANNPQGSTERQTVLSSAQTVVDNFHQLSQSMNDQLQATNSSLTATTDTISTSLKQVADLNAQLRDNRDLLLKGLAQKVGISSQEQSDGTMTVTLGSVSGGPALVSGTIASILGTDGGNPAAIMLKAGAGDAGTDVTALISADTRSGELGGALQVRDQTLPGFLGTLDSLASSLATQVNTLHAAGTGLTGSTGVDFFTAPTSPSGYSRTMALNITSANDVAASGTPSTGTGDNTNALALAALKNGPIIVAGSQTTVPGLYGSLVGQVGLAVQGAQQGVTQSSTMLTQLDNLRESLLGVNMDEELSKLISFQKGYEGAAKLIVTGQEMIDTVLNMVR
jgi:flagellar hook-associated protein 1